MTLTAALLAPLALAAAAGEAQPAAAGLAPFELADRVIYVRGSINGSRPLWLLVSSGSAGSAVDKAVAAELGLTGAAGARLEVGGAQLPLDRVGIIDLSGAEDQAGREIDAVIGYELFRRFVVEIDYYGQVLRLHEPLSYRPDPRAATLPLRIDGRRAYLNAGVELAGLAPFRRDYRLDTGIGGALSDEKVGEAASPKVRIESGGDEQFAVTLTRARAVQIGPFRFAGANEFAGEPAIGGELLRRFTAVIDYGRGQLGLLPNRHYDDRFCFEMLGVELSAARGEGGLRVDALYRGSTAEQAGIAVGDILTAIDGRPVGELALAQVRMMFGQQNSYSLSLRRGDVARTVPVVLSPTL
jgi:hypothetical protein